MTEPLAGKRIVVTRAKAQARQLGEQLEARGASVVYCAAIQVAPPVDASEFETATAQIASYDWVVLTSANGVGALAAEVARQGGAMEHLAGVKFGCVGPATAEALERRGLRAALIPAEFRSSEIAVELLKRTEPGSRILLIRGQGADPELPRRLRAEGVRVDDVQAYRSVPDLENVESTRHLLEAGEVDAITFTSPSAATYFLAAVGAIPEQVVLAAIGPVTAERLRELGHMPQVVASEHTRFGLVDALADHFEALRNEQL